MAIDKIMDIAGSAMNAQLVRMNTTATNLANANVVAGSPEAAFKAKRAVFATILEQAGANLQQQPAGGVRVTDIVDDRTPVQSVYEPGNPRADVNGFVWTSNINPMVEMVDMLDASRAYQNNIEVIATAKDLLLRTLDIAKA